jgi:outer membrane immunogenic protein
MKRLLLAFLALGAFAVGPALAADMSAPAPAPIYTKAPPAPVSSWTGFYLNGGGGYAMWTADTTTVSSTTGACVLCTTQTQGGKGWFGTVGGGFDYQFTDHIVAGVLADWDFSSIKGTIQDQGPFFAGTLTENWSWAAGARIGWLITPAILSYVNGGYSQTHFGSANMVNTFAGLPSPYSTAAFSQSGWFLGGGVETSLASFIPGLFSRTEYRYQYYGTATLADTCPTPGVGACGGPQNSITFHPSVQSIRSELVYKFNWMH